MITLTLTEVEAKLLREAALALELHMTSLAAGADAVPGGSAHAKLYRAKSARARELYAKLADVT